MIPHDDIDLRLRQIRTRLLSHEARLHALDGASPEGTDWEPTVDRADLLLAGVAATEQWLEMGGDGTLPDDIAAVIDRFPGFDERDFLAIAELDGRGALGSVMFVRGFVAEQQVADLLDAGIVPGPPDAEVRLAPATNTPGHDLSLRSPDGSITYAQVKVGADGSAIADHVARYPDIDVVYTTSDAADSVAGVDGITVLRAGDAWPDDFDTLVIDMGTTSDELTELVADAVVAGNELGTIGDDLLEAIPVLSFALIAAGSAWRWAASDDATDAIARRAGQRVKEVAIASGAGTVVSSLSGIDLLAAPVTVATSLGRNAWRSATTSVARSTRRAVGVRAALARIS